MGVKTADTTTWIGFWTDDVLDLNQDGEGDRILLRANNGNDNGVDIAMLK